MERGAVSRNHSVKDLGTSAAFCRKIGVAYFGGNPEQGYVIVENSDSSAGMRAQRDFSG